MVKCYLVNLNVKLFESFCSRVLLIVFEKLILRKNYFLGGIIVLMLINVIEACE